MIETAVKNKMLRLEAQLEMLKRTLLKDPDFVSDDKVWKELKPASRKIRKQLYKEVYGKR